MRRGSRTWAKVAFLALPALFVPLLVLELGALRWFVAVDDVPIEDWSEADALVRYRPDQQGVTFPDGERLRPVPFRINAQGWSSHHDRYETEGEAPLRVAVVGDSYVAAFQVRPAESVSARLEARLGSERAEVYAFGMNGAPLSQYLHVTRHVIRRYRPDAVALMLVHNDFDESFRPVAGRYTKSFLRLDLSGDEVREIPPVPYEVHPLFESLRRSATFRFFFYRAQIGSRQLRDLYHRFADERAPRYEANVDVNELDLEKQRIERATQYVFRELAALQRTAATPIVLLMDAPRFPLYRGEDPERSEAHRLNRLARRLAAREDLAFADLTPAFRHDWESHRQRFEFPNDGHWNARAHALAARELCSLLSRSERLRPIDCREDPSP